MYLYLSLTQSYEVGTQVLTIRYTNTIYTNYLTIYIYLEFFYLWMFTFIISLTILKHSGTKQDLYYDSHHRWREVHGLVLTAGRRGGGSDTWPRVLPSYQRQREYCDSPRNILTTGMVWVLLPCYSLGMLADYQIIKLLMKLKTSNNTGKNTVKSDSHKWLVGESTGTALWGHIWATQSRGLRVSQRKNNTATGISGPQLPLASTVTRILCSSWVSHRQLFTSYSLYFEINKYCSPH